MSGGASDIQIEDFAASFTTEGDRVLLVLKGNADMRVVDAVAQLLPAVHAEALRAGATEVVTDMRDLEFMTSACFKSFVTWLSELEALDPASGYKVVVLSSAKRHWQKRSLQALTCFAVDRMRVEVSA